MWVFFSAAIWGLIEFVFLYYKLKQEIYEGLVWMTSLSFGLFSLYRTSGDNSVLYDHDLESYALFDMDGNKVPQQLVTKVGEAFESILEEANQVRAENSEDMSVSRAISIVFKRRPDLRLDGHPHKVLQWYLCRMEGWFVADADTISLKCWDEGGAV